MERTGKRAALLILAVDGNLISITGHFIGLLLLDCLFSNEQSNKDKLFYRSLSAPLLSGRPPRDLRLCLGELSSVRGNLEVPMDLECRGRLFECVAVLFQTDRTESSDA